MFLLREEIQNELKKRNRTIIVLDDDPTGTQTVHNVPVLTEWTQVAIQTEFEQKTPIFFILTNSRSLIAEKANELAYIIGQNIMAAALKTQRDFYIISRGDSTLRGHFPNEVEALVRGLSPSPALPKGEGVNSPPFGGTERGAAPSPLGRAGEGLITALIPAFFEGNRFTKNDIHYWKNGEEWIPVGETPYAKDATFGYKNSDLKRWIEEKTEGKTKASEVVSFDTNTAPKESLWEGVDFAIKKLNKIIGTKTIIVNALNYNDLEIFALAALRCKRPIIYRTAASFVKAFSGIESQPFWTPTFSSVGATLAVALDHNRATENPNESRATARVAPTDTPTDTPTGGLIIVGSHVPKTTAQLNELLKTDIEAIEFQIRSSDDFKSTDEYRLKIEKILRGGKNVVLYTSRQVILGKNEAESLELSVKISEALVNIVQNLTVQPQFLIAKGGITSSDLATKALGVKRAIVLGQISAGVPVWELGEESKFPNIPYIIFPGNVGENEDLRKVYLLLNVNNML